MPESRPESTSGRWFEHDQFGVQSISDALDEALAEHERDPQTEVWLSFWDRLTDGAYVPERRPSTGDRAEAERDRYREALRLIAYPATFIESRSVLSWIAQEALHGTVWRKLK